MAQNVRNFWVRYIMFKISIWAFIMGELQKKFQVIGWLQSECKNVTWISQWCNELTFLVRTGSESWWFLNFLGYLPLAFCELQNEMPFSIVSS